MTPHPVTTSATTPSGPYIHGLRHHPQTWRTVLAVLAGFGAILLVLVLAAPLGAAVDRLLGIPAFDPDSPTLTVGFWVVGNLLLAALIPASGLLQWALYRTRPRWLSSVEGGFRWKVLGRAAVFIIPIWVVYIVVAHLLVPVEPLRFTAVTIGLSLVALVTVPLQSAGEEYLFRGLMFRAIGARFRRPLVGAIVATTVTAVLFGAIHGSTDAWALAYYLLAGVCFALVVQVTGGLEVAVLIHATNNTLLLLPTILAGQLGELSVTTGPVLLLPMGVMALATVIMWRVAPRLTRHP